ncbi:STAS domain-containing protein [Actinophytocola xanthii]|uniref:STAS domain-containing protein n=1 Tax=Actinophytocola xanthii TaxID=1912961 RepID=UPI0018E95D64|nr:STAS domain-containing protein [Actinophytocola xanthii]
MTCTWSTPHSHTGRIALVGELDYSSVEEFLVTITERLEVNPGLRDLHIDCRDLEFCDSLGLAALLTVHRRVVAAGAVLHLDNRRPAFDRMLTITGTLHHLAGGAHKEVGT